MTGRATESDPGVTAGDATTEIVREIEIAAAPETVFAFFVDADKLTRWLAVEARLDPRPGGECYQVHEGYRRSGPFHMRGEFLAVEAPARVVFSWGFDESVIGAPAGSSTVEVTLDPVPGGTRLRLVHRGLSPAARRDAAGGWVIMLDRLRGAVAA